MHWVIQGVYLVLGEPNSLLSTPISGNMVVYCDGPGCFPLFKKKKQESLTKLGIYAKEVDRGTLGTHSHYSTRFSFMNLGRHFFK